MAELTPEARHLFAAGQRAHEPDAEAERRVSAALRARIGAAALGTAIAVHPSTASAAKGIAVTAKLWWAGSAGALISAAVAGAVWLAPSSEPAASTPSAAAASHGAAKPAGVRPDVAPRASDALLPASAPPPPPIKASARPPVVDLRQEAELLARAQRALRSGQPGLALEVLAEHAQKFPRGALAQEREAARALASCKLGRTAEGLASIERLRRQAPSSVHLKRAEAACR